MKSLLYYMPERRYMDTAGAIESGLGYIAGDGITIECSEVGTGPDGKAGVVFRSFPAGTSQDNTCQYQPDTQEWYKCRDGKLWIGTIRDYLTVPADLARTNQLEDGIIATLEDGQRWNVPVVTLLPMRYRRGINGEQTKEARPEHRHFRDVCDGMYQAFCEINTPTYEQLANGIAEAFSLNYRMHRDEIEILGLLGDTTYWRVALQIVGMDRIDEILSAQEKKRLIQQS